LKGWTGKGLRRNAPLPRRGYGSSTFVELAGLEDFATLANAFAVAQMNGEAQKTFIRRQLRGRDTVRTVADFHKVFSGYGQSTGDAINEHNRHQRNAGGSAGSDRRGRSGRMGESQGYRLVHQAHVCPFRALSAARVTYANEWKQAMEAVREG